MFLVACFFPSNTPVTTTTPIADNVDTGSNDTGNNGDSTRRSSDYRDDNRDSEGRSRYSDRRDSRDSRNSRDSRYSYYRDRTTNDRCEDDSRCEDLCDDLNDDFGYSRRTCEDLQVSEVEALAEISEALEDPDEDELSGVDPEGLVVLLEEFQSQAEKLVAKYSTNETKDVLTWIAQNSDIAKIFADEDEEYQVFKEILAQLDSVQEEALTDTIYDGDSFVEIAVDENTEALELINEIFNEDCETSSSDNDAVTRCTFRKYCSLSDDISDYTREDYLDYSELEELVSTILDDFRPSNPPTWWTADVNDVDDVDNDWGDDSWENVCNSVSF